MDEGLSSSEAARRLREDGPNELQAAHSRPLWRLLLSVLTEPMFALLLACGALYAVLGSAQEAWTLMGFVGVVMAISLVQQQRAEAQEKRIPFRVRSPARTCPPRTGCGRSACPACWRWALPRCAWPCERRCPG